MSDVTAELIEEWLAKNATDLPTPKALPKEGGDSSARTTKRKRGKAGE